jgi:predicted CoA-binding protein
MDWKENLITTDEQLRELLSNTHRIAVLGIKPESHSSQPAFYVPSYMAETGAEIIPVPVYYPEVTEILGKKVYRDLKEIQGKVDMVNVFRRSQDVLPHVDDILAIKPDSVWLQQGIRNDEAAEKWARAGIKVVQDMCILVVHRILMR